MKFEELKKIFADKPLIRTSHLFSYRQRETLLNEISYWQKKRLIIKLKKGLYIFNEENRKIEVSKLFIANELYFPSYISCEHTLYFYGMIPEKVEDVISVTTKKTKIFKNNFGTFYYHHIKPCLFFSFRKIMDKNNLPFLIATPEKAIFDFLYFKMKELKEADKDIFEYSYRFQNLEDLNFKNLDKMAKKVKNKNFQKIIKNFISYARSVL